MKTEWNEQFKIRIANPDESMLKHDVIKLIIVRKLMLKYKKDRSFIHIYTEWDLGNNKIADVYFEDTRKKICYAFEIQKSLTKSWVDNTLSKYKDWENYGFNSSDLIIIPIKDSPDDLTQLNKWLDSYIF